MSYIEFRNVSKAFGPCISCKNISLSIERAGIHAIIGENGAGKSTLMKLLGGLEPVSSGQIFLNSQPYIPQSAQDAFKNKIAFIHQHFVLADQLTALDNLVLSASSRNFSLGFKSTTEVAKQALALLTKFGWEIDLQEYVKNLSVGEQQRLEILKALMQEPDILIFDEPTAVLSPLESEDLLRFILQLKQTGKTIILISHKLHEIKSVADHISILRHGELIATRAASELNVDALAELMIGRKIIKTNSVQRPAEKKAAILLPGTRLYVNQSEIFGVAGIEGNGQSELIAQLLQSVVRGNITFGDITEDRLRLSIFEEFNLNEHMLLKHRQAFMRKNVIHHQALQKATHELVQQWDVRPPDTLKPLAELSGGNQQKFMVGRELWHQPEILLAAHPTRGVDLGAQERIHQALLNYSENQKTVVLVSSDLDEVLFLSDRFVILNKEYIYGPFLKNQLSEKEIGLYMAGDLPLDSTPHLLGEL